MKKKIITLAASLIIFGCSTTQPTVSASVDSTEGNFKKISHRWQDYSYADFTTGRNLYETNCSRCHQLHRPADFSEQQWTDILPNMIGRARLGDAERESIFRYLITAAEHNIGMEEK